LGRYSVITGGKKNNGSGEYSVVNGGFNNTATRDYAIAMGRNAEAVNNNSFVVNLSSDEDAIVKSQSNGQFLMNVDAFTISVGAEEATIDSSNIGSFKSLLSNGRRMLKKSDNMNSIVKELKEEKKLQQGLIFKLQEQISKQEGQNNEQEEQIEKIARMLKTLLDTNNNNNNKK
jgi:hypothetical protein